MEKYINFILESIINDVGSLEHIYHNYAYLTWIFVGFFWCWWILIKNIFLTLPIWALYNLTIGKFKFNIIHSYNNKQPKDAK